MTWRFDNGQKPNLLVFLQICRSVFPKDVLERISSGDARLNDFLIFINLKLIFCSTFSGFKIKENGLIYIADFICF